jgi:hypothetical protein
MTDLGIPCEEQICRKIQGRGTNDNSDSINAVANQVVISMESFLGTDFTKPESLLL